MKRSTPVYEVALCVVLGGLVGVLAMAGATTGVALGILLGGFGLLLGMERRGQLQAVANATLVATAFTMTWDGFDVGPFEVSDYLLFLTIGLFVMIRLQGSSGPHPAPNLFRPMLVGVALVSAGGIAGAIAEPPGPYIYSYLNESLDLSGFAGNMGALARFLLGTLGPFGLFVLARLDRERLRQVMLAFALGGTVSAVLGFVVPRYTLAGRTQGLAAHPTHFGTLCLFSIGCAMALVLSRRRAWLPGLLVPILVAGLLLSGSRASLGGLAVACLVLGPFTQRRVVMGGAIVCGVLLSGLLLFGAVNVKGENAIARALDPNSSSAERSNEARSDLQSKLIDRWEQVPITGTGLSYLRASHNVYLGLLASGGVLALLGFVAFFRHVIRRVIASRHDVLTMALMSTYLGYLVAAMFDNIFWWRWLWFFVSMVLVAAATARPREPEAHGDEPAPAAGDRASEPVVLAGASGVRA